MLLGYVTGAGSLCYRLTALRRRLLVRIVSGTECGKKLFFCNNSLMNQVLRNHVAVRSIAGAFHRRGRGMLLGYVTGLGSLCYRLTALHRPLLVRIVSGTEGGEKLIFVIISL
jgi:hypothetical protein